MGFGEFNAITLALLLLFAISVVGHLIGSINIKGVTLGTAAVFIVALVVGHFGYAKPDSFFASLNDYNKIIQNLGLILFVTSVGFIAGPNFFRNLKKNAKSYVLLGALIIVSGALTCVAIIALTSVDTPLAVGLLSGALTSTPGFSAAKDAVDPSLVSQVAVGNGIAYPFGVVGIVLFVQVVPRLVGANMEEERKMLVIDGSESRKHEAKRFSFDAFGLTGFSLAVLAGIAVGSITIPLPGGAEFSLGNTGGCLIMALVFGHFAHIGHFDISCKESVLKTFREFGLILFLTGSGLEGGAEFVSVLKEYGVLLFVYGALMTIVPMVAGYFFARYVLKLHLLNNLGSITGGMTSTPALGSLIATAGTEDVASAYAATYPIALVLVVLASQLIVLFF